MTGFHRYLQSVLPLKPILISLGVGLVSFAIVLFAGLSNDFVTSGTVASRAFSAFAFAGLVCFIVIMSGEEYAIFKTRRELETFIDDAPFAETEEIFNRSEYVKQFEPKPKPKPEPKPEIEAAVAPAPDAEPAFRPLDFAHDLGR